MIDFAIFLIPRSERALDSEALCALDGLRPGRRSRADAAAVAAQRLSFALEVGRSENGSSGHGCFG